MKSILDVPATLELLETLSVPVLGTAPTRSPASTAATPGRRCPGGWTTRRRWPRRGGRTADLGGGAGMVLAQPVPAADELDADLHDRLLAEGLRWWPRTGSPARTSPRPCWRTSTTRSDGASLAANLALVLANAELAAQVAVALAG